ncbi:MAG: AmmeMemoRadiSam system radical SAM enzyme, partial [Candidatus Altiarchaeota archaeon]|nr:AmmeMemoRadiSam system radical SAM enzyme [Candidatus Altiarchaeota archaeon]
CRGRVNYQGKLYSLVYGNPCSVHVDPIEKKPLFHFLPGTTSFSLATAGCNLRCLNCQNWEISQFTPEETENMDLMPDTVVDAAVNNGCASVAYTYSEPMTFYEYMHETSRLAHERGLRNAVITAGYVNEEPLRDLCKVVDAIRVDLKGFKEETYNKLNSATLQPVLDTLKTIKDEGVWLEVINLVVPTWTDDLDTIRDMCRWLYRNLGPDYPLHFSRFIPEYKLASLPQTPVETLESARKIAMDEGLDFVYIGNVPGHEAESTYCPQHGGVAIERRGYTIVQNNIDKDGYCLKCGEKIPGVWK